MRLLLVAVTLSGADISSHKFRNLLSGSDVTIYGGAVSKGS